MAGEGGLRRFRPSIAASGAGVDGRVNPGHDEEVSIPFDIRHCRA
jgi:hypothetical protein